MKVIIPEKKLDKIVFEFLDMKLFGVEQTEGESNDIIFKYPNKVYGVLGWNKSGELKIFYKLIDDISKFIPLNKTEIRKIIGRYVEDTYNLKVNYTVVYKMATIV